MSFPTLRRLTWTFAAVVTAAAQPPSPTPTFRATTELVQVNLVALDGQGKPVADLRQEEFQLFDNGMPQAIQFFSGLRAIPSPQPPETNAVSAFSNVFASQAGAQTGYTAIVIDNLYSGSDPDNEEGSAYARSRALEMLRLAPEGEKIAIYAPGLKFTVICEFTSDRDLLVSQLKKWKPMATTPPAPRATLGGPLDRLHVEMQNRAAAEAARIEALLNSDIGDSQFESLADHLAGIPGRKKMIWLANKFPISPRALGKLNGAGVSLYPVDIDGVCRLCPERPKQLMDAIAAVTGGLAYYTRNDIPVAMTEALNDGHVSYTLGFYRSGEEDGAPGVHRLAIRVSRPGVTLRYGNTYLPAERLPAAMSAADLIRALDRPVDATTIPVNATVTKARNRLTLDMTLDVQNLGLLFELDHWTARVELVVRFGTAEATITGDPVAQTVSFNLTQEKYDAALSAGFAYHRELEIPPKAANLKILLANPASGKIGTLTIPLSKVKASAAISQRPAR